jgi:hypothetical protein
MPVEVIGKKGALCQYISSILRCLIIFSGNQFFITFAVRKKIDYGKSMSGYRKTTYYREHRFPFKYKNPQEIFTESSKEKIFPCRRE